MLSHKRITFLLFLHLTLIYNIHMADEGKKFMVRKIVAPVAKPKAKPGAPPSQYTLRVKDPNDKRLKMYEDSVLATGRAVATNKFVKELDKMPMEKKRAEVLRGTVVPIESMRAIGRLEKENKKPYREGADKSITTPLNAPKGTGYNPGSFKLMANPKGDLKEVQMVQGANVLTPRRKVILEKPEIPKPEKPKPTPVAPPRPKPAPVKELEIRPASTDLVKPKEEKERDVKMVPVKEPLKEKRIGMGSILRNPDQSLLGKIKRRFNGEPNERYWVDKDGVKRFPKSRGENDAKTVQEIKMAKGDLDPKVPEDKVQLDRIDAYFKNKSSQKE
jgi:hypothetical protein